jgi:sec-independent protein translocase protein TatA|tara:strand:- start:14 stop:187 length:174 start_codon:yes stop_codon:yes gene_type:complete
MIGTTEALIIGAVVLLLFGAKKLPELAKSMGQSKAAFNEGLKEGPSSEEDEDKDDED